MDLQLFFDNFEVIAAAPNGVKKLRELILQLAVRGKLVPQDPADEPAGKLLERLVKKEAKYSASKKKPNRESLHLSIEEESELHKIPNSWEWSYLWNLGLTQTGTTPPTNQSELYGNDYPFVKPANISQKEIDCQINGLSSLGILKGRLVPKESVLMVCIGGSIGKVGLVDRKCSCNQQINYISLYSDIFPKTIFYFLQSPYFQSQVLRLAPSTTMPILSKGKWDCIPLPLPPLSEQKRIVAKVDELMKLCDTLETQQQQNRSHLSQMQKSAIAQLLSAPDADAFAQHWQDIVENFELLFDDGGAIGDLRQAILQLAVQGKLVRQDSADEPVEELFKRIQEKRSTWISESRNNSEARTVDKKLKQHNPDYPNETIPKSWRWVSLLESCWVVVDCHNKTATYTEKGIPLVRVIHFSKG